MCHGGDLWQRKLPTNGTDVKERVTRGLRSYSLAHRPIPSDRDTLLCRLLKVLLCPSTGSPVDQASETMAFGDS